ncbi:carbohydrate ABC transporter permease [Naumannella halotolerans]|uniref:Sorbitol/mannitol transport system permease protein n=1 Tax=Naumannella halotolerans TaxID=993414 RepID=A0A4R7J9Q1_9ACTN|nr:carbohydrate ABC transporter permease [Naumannella halotolerans]TDT34271.1 sorbitol/mannitol transport system permease protein [Naumannella halotolerans]
MTAVAEPTRTNEMSSASTARTGRKGGFRIGGLALTVLTWLLVLFFFFPVGWTIFTSFKSEAAAASATPLIFTPLSFEQYAEVFRRGMGLYLLNSAAVAVLSTVVVMALAIPAAYALSVRKVRRWTDALFFVISTRFMPFAAVIIPIFLLLRELGLLDNLTVLGVLYVGMNLPLAIWMMRSFFDEVPAAIVEAAHVDGASYWKELWRIAFPIVAPGAAAAALICFIFAWNEYFLALLLTSVTAMTTPPFLGSFVDGRGQFLAVLSAAITIAIIPVIIAGWVAQKRLVAGLAMGAVK